MRLDDITPQTQLISSTQEEAVQNIQGSKVFDIGPDMFKEQKEIFQPELEAMTRTPVATPVVAQAIKKSPEHAAAVAPDADNLSWIERQWGTIGNAVSNKVGPEREILDLGWKKLSDKDNFSEDDDLRLSALQEDAASNFGRQDFGLKGPWETLPADVIAQGADMAALAWRNKGTIGVFTGSNALLGAGTGIVGGAPGVAAGAVRGAVAGTIFGYTVASMMDAYRSTAGSTYLELSNATAEDGTPLAIDEGNKKYLSHGVGMISGSLSFVTDRLMIKSLPFLKKLANPKKVTEFLMNKANAPVRDAILNIGKVMAINGSEEALQEVTQILGEEIGNTYNDSEVSFYNGIVRASQKISEGKFNDRIGRAGLVGAFSAGAFALGGTGIDVAAQKMKGDVKVPLKPDYVPPKTDVIVESSPEQQSVRILEFQDAVDTTTKVAQHTKLYNIDKTQVHEVVGEIAKTNFKQKYVYFDKEDLQTFSKDETRAERVRSLIVQPEDPLSEIADGPAAVINAPVRVEMHKFLEMVDEYPDLSEYVKLNPEGPNPKSAREFATRLEETEKKRAEIKEKLGAKDITPEEKATLEEALNLEQPMNDVFGEQDYLNQPTFTQAIEGVISDTEVKTVNDAQILARQQVVTNINETAQYEMNKVIDIVEAQATETQAEIEANRIANDPNVAIVDHFTTKHGFYPSDRYQHLSDMTEAHHKKGFSPFAIDPRTLTEKQQAKFLSDPQLKKHKVFVKGGISAENSARLLGVNSGENLLKILSKTPSRQDIVDASVAKRAKEIRDLATDSVDLNKTALANAYHAKTANHIAEMKFLLSEKWGAVKKGIRRVALPLPKIEELTYKARAAVYKTKVGDLNANQYKVGERKSQRIAVDAVLKNDLEKAFINKQNAALNSELSLATHQAIGKVNRVIKFAKKFKKADVMQELKDAGPAYVKAAEELLDVFNLDPSKRGLSERGAYQKWVKQQIEDGNDNFEISERLSDLRESINDMTVEETLLVGDRLKSILHQARHKNKLYNQFGDPAKELQTLEALVAKMHEASIAHPEYDENRTLIAQGDIGVVEKFKAGTRTLFSMLKNMEHILLNADGGKVGGIYNETIVAMLKGIGRYAGQGEQGKINDMIALEGQMKKVIQSFGEEDWKKLQMEKVEVPEWESNKLLNFGKLTKANLFMMLLNNGNEGNVQRMADNFKTDIETIRSVLEKNLDEKHAIAAQRILDMYASYAPRVQKLHSDMTGVDVEMVEAVPFTFKGKVYPGGYYPLNYASEMSLDKIRRRTDKAAEMIEGGRKISMKDTFYADDMTRHNHTEKRTGSDRPINISMNSIGMGFEMILHDLNFRKPIADALKIVTHPTVAKDIAATVGLDDYNVVVNTVVDAAQSTQMENNALFDSSRLWDKVESRARSGMSVGYLVGNIGSIAIQPVSMAYAVERMGKRGPEHLLNTLNAVIGNPHLIKDFYEFAGDIHPAIKQYLEGIDENTRDAISKLMPKKRLSKGTAPIEAMREVVNDMGFAALGQVDQFQKVVVVLSAYRQFLDGEAPGFDYDKVQSMTKAERDHQARVYASSVARLTLTAGSQIDRAPIQKKYKNISMFWNDARNALNNSFRQGREIRQSVKKKDFLKASGLTLSAMLTLAMARLMSDVVRGNPTPLSGGEEGENPEDMAQNMMMYLAGAPINVIASNTPLVRDIQFTMNKWGYGRKTVTPPTAKMLTDIYETVNIGINFMDAYESGLSPAELKSAAFTASYATGGIPVNMMFKLYELYDEWDIETVKTEPVTSAFLDRLEDFKKNNEDVDPEILKALDEIKVSVLPEDPPPIEIPEESFEVVKQMISQGKWNVVGTDGEAGIYQFTEKMWNEIREENPDLGLTENGRVSKDPEQQEKAMRHLAYKNAGYFQVNDIEATKENIYLAHILGVEKAVKLLKATGDDKIKSLVGESFINANGLKNGMKVRDFKEWVTKKASEAELELEQLASFN